MAVRITGIARGGSGAHPGSARHARQDAERRVHPVVCSVGSVGAPHLMHMAGLIALVVTGRGAGAP